MEEYIRSIEQYLDETNKDKIYDEIDVEYVTKPIIEDNKPVLEIDIEKTTLDMKILKNRMDSVSIIKYYKDLKNNRIKPNENVAYVDTEKDINDIINKTNHDKPWAKADNYTKRKKIESFIDKLLVLGKIENIDIVKSELKDLLENKKISKKNIEFDFNNNIIKLGNYSLV